MLATAQLGKRVGIFGLGVNGQSVFRSIKDIA